MTGRELEQKREQVKMSRAELARRLKLSHVTIWRWETERTKIKGDSEKAVQAILAEA